MKRKYFYPIILMGAFIFFKIIESNTGELESALILAAIIIFIILTIIGFEIYKLIRKKIDSNLSEKEIEEEKKFKITKSSGFVILVIIATIIFLIKIVKNY